MELHWISWYIRTQNGTHDKNWSAFLISCLLSLGLEKQNPGLCCRVWDSAPPRALQWIVFCIQGFLFRQNNFLAPSSPKRDWPSILASCKCWESLPASWHLSSAENELGVDLDSPGTWATSWWKACWHLLQELRPRAPPYALHISDHGMLVPPYLLWCVGTHSVRCKELVSGLPEDASLQQSEVWHGGSTVLAQLPLPWTPRKVAGRDPSQPCLCCTRLPVDPSPFPHASLPGCFHPQEPASRAPLSQSLCLARRPHPPWSHYSLSHQFSREPFPNYSHMSAHAMRLRFWEARLTREPHERCFSHKHPLDHPEGILHSVTTGMGSRPHECRLQGCVGGGNLFPRPWLCAWQSVVPSLQMTGSQMSHTPRLSAHQLRSGLFVFSDRRFFIETPACLWVLATWRCTCSETWAGRSRAGWGEAASGEASETATRGQSFHGWCHRWSQGHIWLVWAMRTQWDRLLTVSSLVLNTFQTLLRSPVTSLKKNKKLLTRKLRSK